MCAQGDSTWFIERCLARSLSGVALSSICDPQAAALCHAAGEGAELQLRFGGKTAPEADSGPPIDALVKVSTRAPRPHSARLPLPLCTFALAARTRCTWTEDWENTWTALGLLHLLQQRRLGLLDCDHACPPACLAHCFTLWRVGLARRW